MDTKRSEGITDPEMAVHIPDSEVPQVPPFDMLDVSEYPSIGSIGHDCGNCKRCCFFPKGRCENGHSCLFCHFDHPKRRRRGGGERRGPAAFRMSDKPSLESGKQNSEPLTLNLPPTLQQLPNLTSSRTSPPLYSTGAGGGMNQMKYSSCSPVTPITQSSSPTLQSPSLLATANLWDHPGVLTPFYPHSPTLNPFMFYCPSYGGCSPMGNPYYGSSSPLASFTGLPPPASLYGSLPTMPSMSTWAGSCMPSLSSLHGGPINSAAMTAAGVASAFPFDFGTNFIPSQQPVKTNAMEEGQFQ